MKYKAFNLDTTKIRLHPGRFSLNSIRTSTKNITILYRISYIIRKIELKHAFPVRLK